MAYSVFRRLKIMGRCLWRSMGSGFKIGPKGDRKSQGVQKSGFAETCSDEKRQADVNEESLGDPIPISKDSARVIKDIRDFLESSEDVTTRDIDAEGVRMTLLYVDGLVDKPTVRQGVLIPLMTELRKARKAGLRASVSPESLARRVLPIHETKILRTVQEIVWSVLDGESVLIGSGWNQALSFDTRGWEKRAVEEPQTESVVRGPREGFVEDLVTNLSLIRRRFRHPNLTIRFKRIGRLTRTRVAFLHVQGLVRNEVLQELHRRVDLMDMDAILGAGYIEELIEDNPFSPFPQVGTTERPDRAIAAMLQGKVIIITDGTPFVLSIPVNATSFLDNPEDYYHRWMGGSIARLTRYMATFASLLLPSLYVAFTTFHQELIPRALALSIATQRELVPYPAIVEASIMLLVFEILTEASARMPKNMGPTIGIVGALVIGEAAVRASLISNVMVIVIALTALSQFVLVYPVTTAVRILRTALLIAGAVLGLYGIFWVFTLILLHLTSLRSFGMPYFAPFAPTVLSDFKDTAIRAPLWTHVKRPQIFSPKNRRRMKAGIKRKQMELGRDLDGSPDSEGKAELETVLDEKSGTEPDKSTKRAEDSARTISRARSKTAMGPPSENPRTRAHLGRRLSGLVRDAFRRLIGPRPFLFLFIPIIAVTSLFSSGCWDRREINQLAIVSSVAVDQEGQDVLLTIEIFRPPGAGANSEGGGVSMPGIRPVVIAEGRGKTFFSAIRDVARKVPRRVYWAQALVCIVGEEFARRSIIEVLDIWDREMELRRTAHLVVAQGKARDIIIKSSGEMESTFAEEVELLARTSKFSGYTTVSSFHDVISGLASDKHTAVTGIVALKTTDQTPLPRSPMPGEEGPLNPVVTRMIELSGVAVFKESKLSAMVPISPESRGIVASIGRLGSTALDLECPCRYVTPQGDASGEDQKDKGSRPPDQWGGYPGERETPVPDLISLKITRAQLRVDVEMRGQDMGTLRGKITLDVDANLSSQKCSRDLTRPPFIEAISQEASRAIKEEMESSLRLMQEVSSDPYGFAEAFHRKYPKAWREVKDRWCQVFRNMPVEIHAGVRLRNTGDIRTPPGRCY